jgi:hypothetical protein
MEGPAQTPGPVIDMAAEEYDAYLGRETQAAIGMSVSDFADAYLGRDGKNRSCWIPLSRAHCRVAGSSLGRLGAGACDASCSSGCDRCRVGGAPADELVAVDGL